MRRPNGRHYKEKERNQLDNAAVDVERTMLDALIVPCAGQTIRVTELWQVTGRLLGHAHVVLAEQNVPLVFSLHVYGSL
jgi:hypothetical protein